MANSYYELAKSDQNIIGIIGYLLQSDIDEIGQKGFLDLGYEVQMAIKKIVDQ